VTYVLIDKLGVIPTRSRRCKSERIQTNATGNIWEGLDKLWT